MTDTMLPGMPEPTPLPTLWAVHVEGPDDIIPAANRADAERMEAAINREWEQFMRRPDYSAELDARWSAKVIRWDGTPAEHAAALAELETA